MIVEFSNDSNYKGHEKESLDEYTCMLFNADFENLIDQEIYFEDTVYEMLRGYQADGCYDMYTSDAIDFVRCFYEDLVDIHHNMKNEYANVPNPLEDVHRFQLYAIEYMYVDIFNNIKDELQDDLVRAFENNYPNEDESEFREFMSNYLAENRIRVSLEMYDYVTNHLEAGYLTEDGFDKTLETIFNDLAGEYIRDHNLDKTI